VYGLAEKLGKFAHEVMAMPEQELRGWLAYYDHQRKLTAQHG